MCANRGRVGAIGGFDNVTNLRLYWQLVVDYRGGDPP